ncbi:hypothetical protein SS50377_25720 [Spironucleus salmonicida]|uniref:Transmembrane protein n=1 Tax=Spironucleus salmonicida TaxID=348837 RepID=V6LDV5_9EUKA|nr:hypothetical protein SS50377_25720 [Spironucleus salmonicida]|eukprot:EST42670.1 Hypothetical protein SS50377_17686 [Spironucleus salmonicida]
MLLILSDLILSGTTYNYTIPAGETIQIQIKHSNTKYLLQGVLETPDSIQITGYFCGSSLDFNTCKQSSSSQFLRNNARTTLNGDVGDYEVHIKNFDKKTVTIYFTYDDSIFLLPNFNYDSLDDQTQQTLFRVPVCSDTVKMQILTDADENSVFYSFTSGDPTQKLPLKDIQPQYPGYLYIKVNQTSFQFSVEQFRRQLTQLDQGYTDVISAFYGCQRVFQFESGVKGTKLIGTASEIDDLSDQQVQLYFLSTFDGNKFPNDKFYDAKSQNGILRAKFTVEDPLVSIISLQMPQRMQFIPHKIISSQEKHYYHYQLFLTSINDALLPCQSLNFSLNQQNLVVAIPFKFSDQAYAVTGRAESNYIVRMSVLNENNTKDTTLSFGHATVQDQSFKTLQLSTPVLSYESTALRSVDAAYSGDLFFATINCKTQCKGYVKAEHSYLLQDRIPIVFNHLETEGDPEFYYANYYAVKGVDFIVQQYTEQIIIYASFTDQLPNLQTKDVQKFTCSIIQDKCIINILNASNTPIFFTVQAKNSIILVAAPIGENIKQIFDSQTFNDSILFGDEAVTGKEYVYKPNSLSQEGEILPQQELLFSLELKNYDILESQTNLNLVAYISNSPCPNSSNYIIKLSALDGSIEKLDDESFIIVTQNIAPLSYHRVFFVTVICEGIDCSDQASSMKILRYSITTYPLFMIPPLEKNGGEASIFPVKNGITTSYFTISPNGYSNIQFIPSNEKLCAKLIYNLHICYGILQSNYVITQQDNCFVKKISSTETYEQLFDLFNSRHQAGRIFIQLSLDLSEFTGSLKVIPYCFARTNLYEFQRILPSKTLLVTNMTRLFGNIPSLSKTCSSNNSPGDRLVIQSKGCDFQICITDDIANLQYAEKQCLNDFKQIHSNDTFTIDYQNWQNIQAVGKLQAHTNIIATVVTSCQVEITIRGQAVIDPNAIGNINFFTYDHYYGNQYLHSYAINTKSLSKINLTLHSGPFCSDIYCRKDKLPDEMQTNTIITAISTKNMLPSLDNSEITVYDKGVQMIQLQNLSGDWVYITVIYRFGFLLSQKNFRSSMPYIVNLLQNYNIQNFIGFQETKSIIHDGSSKFYPIDHYQSKVSYIPSQLVIYPCKGRPAVLIDPYAPQSSPLVKDYQQLLVQTYGRPIQYIYSQEQYVQIQSFVSVFDYNRYDLHNNTFTSNDTKMEYEVYFGSTVQQIRPGNQGKLTIIKYDNSNQGSITIRFYPASTSYQQDDLAQVNYLMYAIPYSGSIDEENDYSPYTTCGIRKKGYPIYIEDGKEYILYDEKQVIKQGYIEITSNQNLFPLTSQGTNIYVTILVGQVAYEAVLGSGEVIAQSNLIYITFAIVIGIILALFLVFFILVIRLRKQQQSGYKHIAL